MRRAMLLLAALPLLAGCVAPQTDEPAAKAEGEIREPERKADGSGTFACRDFRKIVGDIDVLTGSELRERVQKVHDNGRLSTSGAIPEASRSLLAAVTSDDPAAFARAAESMAAACAEYGV